MDGSPILVRPRSRPRFAAIQSWHWHWQCASVSTHLGATSTRAGHWHAQWQCPQLWAGPAARGPCFFQVPAGACKPRFVRCQHDNSGTIAGSSPIECARCGRRSALLSATPDPAGSSGVMCHSMCGRALDPTWPSSDGAVGGARGHPLARRTIVLSTEKTPSSPTGICALLCITVLRFLRLRQVPT
jgi:hypothetical protein